MLRQPDVLAGLAGAIATVPLLALALAVVRPPARSALAGGADAIVAAVLGAAVVAAVRGGAPPWRGVVAVEAAANAVLALACLCALLPPLSSRLGAGRGARALAALAGAAIVLRGGLALALHAGLAVRDDTSRITGIALGVALACAVTALLVAALRVAAPRRRARAAPWLVAACGVVALSTAVAQICSEHALLPIQLRVTAASTFAAGSTAETVLAALTGVAHAVPRAQIAAIVVALAVGAALAAWAARRPGVAGEVEPL